MKEWEIGRLDGGKGEDWVKFLPLFKRCSGISYFSYLSEETREFGRDKKRERTHAVTEFWAVCVGVTSEVSEVSEVTGKSDRERQGLELKQ